jgi:hypothetical protein
MPAKPTKPAIADDPSWPVIRQWIDPEEGQQNQSRFPFHKDTPPRLLEEWSKIAVPCYCGVLFHPIRSSDGDWAPALYATGPKAEGHKGCSSTAFARERAQWTKEDLGKAVRTWTPLGDQGLLFEQD